MKINCPYNKNQADGSLFCSSPYARLFLVVADRKKKPPRQRLKDDEKRDSEKEKIVSAFLLFTQNHTSVSQEIAESLLICVETVCQKKFDMYCTSHVDYLRHNVLTPLFVKKETCLPVSTVLHVGQWLKFDFAGYATNKIDW